MITLLVMTNGRMTYLHHTLESFDEMVSGTITRRVIHDDSGDPGYVAWLKERYGDEYEIIHGGDVLGFAGAVQRAWSELAHDENRFTFHLEDDFLFNRSVDLDELADFLEDRWWLAQLALRRSPWGREREGFVEDMRSAYSEREAVWKHQGTKWIEHKLYYTMTPHIYRSRLRMVGWPDGQGTEVTYKDRLMETGLPWGVPGNHVRFGFWGGVEDGADAVTHIGVVRKGHGY